jgi:hypothetical protein
MDIASVVKTQEEIMNCPDRLGVAVCNTIAEAMENTAISLAYDLGYASQYDLESQDWWLSDEDIQHAAREPISLATVMVDLCVWLGMDTPDLLAGALDDEVPPIDVAPRAPAV